VEQASFGYVVMAMSPSRHSSVTSRQNPPLPLGSLWREAAGFVRIGRRFMSPPRRRPGRPLGAPVLVIPGFLANDSSTALLRSHLRDDGYDVHGWGQGVNLGATAERLETLAAMVAATARRRREPVSLVGWSLGGLYAREVAKMVPGEVARVVTLGSPFSGNPRGNRAWWLYEWINGHPVDAPPIECDLSAKPPVPTIALWSSADGIVAPLCARGLPHESDHAIELSCSHIGFTFEPNALAAVLEALKR
jgi:hypothetical protein